MNQPLTLFNEALLAAQPALASLARRWTSDRDEVSELVQRANIAALELRSTYTGRPSFDRWITAVAEQVYAERAGEKKIETTVCMSRVPSDHRSLALEATQFNGLSAREELVFLEYLNPDTRAAILSIAVDNLDYEDAARYAGISVGTLKARVSRGRARLRGLIDGNSEDFKAAAAQSVRRKAKQDAIKLMLLKLRWAVAGISKGSGESVVSLDEVARWSFSKLSATERKWLQRTLSKIDENNEVGTSAPRMKRGMAHALNTRHL